MVGIWITKNGCTVREVIGCNGMVKDPIVSPYFSLFRWMTFLICFRNVIQNTRFTTCPTGTPCGALHPHCQKQSTWLYAKILWHVNFSLRVMCSCAIQRTIFHPRIIGKDSTFIFSNNLQQDVMQWQSPSWSVCLSVSTCGTNFQCACHTETTPFRMLLTNLYDITILCAVCSIIKHQSDVMIVQTLPIFSLFLDTTGLPL